LTQPFSQTSFLSRTLAPAATTQPALALNPLKTLTIKPASFKVQDLPENTTFTLNLPKTLTIEPVLLISSAAAIPASAPTAIPTFAPTFTTLIVSALVLAELTLLPTPEMAVLSPATCIPTEP
jgi:hypothetical protein